MAISTKTFTTMVSDQITAIQAKSSLLINFTIGSVLRALVEANSAVGLWMQGMIVALLATTRAATSVGSDVDSWMADFGVTRLAAVAATGNVTFSRFTPTLQATIPFGSIVQTADGSQKYAVTIDTGNAAYTAGGYVIAPGVTSVTVPAAAQTAAALGNVAANQITTLGQAITYVDTVNNEAAFANGANAETDTALRTRFVAYLASLSRATKAAVAYAIATVQATATYTLIENQQYNGTTDNGYFSLVVDDGSGAPPVSFLTNVSNAVDAVRPITTRFGVFAPVIVNATVTMTTVIASGYDPVATQLAVQAALQAYINSLTLGQTLTFSRMTQIAYDASAGVSNITAVTLNGGSADLAATTKQVIKYVTVTVS
jgi:uncharacterized phage protein gp47/JayE